MENPRQEVDQSASSSCPIHDSSHTPRPLFTELQQLANENNRLQWRETARWVKFEENVEEGGNRWSKPHVASLPLNSFVQLKEFIGKGRVLLDLEAESMERLAELVVDGAELDVKTGEKVRKIILKRKIHQFQMIKSKENKVSLMCHKVGTGHKGGSKVRKKDEALVKGETKVEILRSVSSISEESFVSEGDPKLNYDFMRKVPQDAEASNVLIGEVDFLEKTLCAFVRLKTATNLGDLSEVPLLSRFFFLLLVPEAASVRYDEVGRAMGTLMSDEVFNEVLYRSRNKNQLLTGIDEFLNVATVLPPGEWDPTIRIEPPSVVPSQNTRKHPPPTGPTPMIQEEELDEEWEEQKAREDSGLARSGVLFGGLINDVKRKVPFYWSDFKDAFATQSIASWIFLYFACLSPIITFGGLLAQATGNNMAAMESLVSGFVCGMIYGLFSGQPLSILGSTGPVLVFETIVYDFCLKTGWDYMSFRFWIGTWVAIILFILVAIDASAYVCYITRFTEENFAFLIALIFIIKAVENVILIGIQFPVNPTGSTLVDYNCSCSADNTLVLRDPIVGKWNLFNKDECGELNGTLIGTGCDTPVYAADVFFLSVLLGLGTFLISVLLKDFKTALFFPTKVRQFISDFAVIIAIVSMTLLDYYYGVPTPKLQVPTEFKPTLPTRGWFIPPFNGNPIYSVFVAIPPALLGTILIFMDQQITSVIINRKEHKLKKKCGYHLDLFVLSILIQICSVMGLPWFVAATVLSINHVNSLKMESECSAPGEKPQFLGVREQRVTHVLIFLTIGLSVFLTPVLGHIPMPVLFGVFLYMGISSLGGLQFFDRILIIFMPNKYQPDYMFLRQVPIRRVHLFTAVQVACFACLWFVKSFSSTSILFPIMLVVMVGVRKALDYVFTKRELKALDNLLPTSRKRNVKGKKGLARFILGPKLISGRLKEGDGADCALNNGTKFDQI